MSEPNIPDPAGVAEFPHEAWQSLLPDGAQCDLAILEVDARRARAGETPEGLSDETTREMRQHNIRFARELFRRRLRACPVPGYWVNGARVFGGGGR